MGSGDALQSPPGVSGWTRYHTESKDESEARTLPGPVPFVVAGTGSGAEKEVCPDVNTMQALEAFQSSITDNPEARESWSDEITWSCGRQEEWGSDRVRIGVIGVTSSGKSTLINAILGREILSSAVAPSSGQLVCCSYGEVPGITVSFEDGSVRRLEGTDYSLSKLQEYSDERYNPGNRKGVLSIELTSPQFDLGHDVVLVDSPGLDAYGLEAHERLTLESLVPTMDMCIYITTTKTNSDEKMRRMLDVVARYHCPIVIVQNMIDAVKASASNDKSRQEVAKDHRRRVQRIVDASQIEDKDAVEIVQMSSKFAVYERIPEAAEAAVPTDEARIASNYRGFADAVSRVLSGLRPVIERQRLMSVRERALDVAAQAEQQMERTPAAVEGNFPLAKLEARFEEHDRTVRKALRDLADHFNGARGTIRENVGIGSKRPQGKVKTDTLLKNLSRVNKLVDSTADELRAVVADHNNFVEKAAGSLRRPSRDLQCPVTLRSFGKISEIQKTKTEIERVKVKGFFKGKVARGLGKFFHQKDWGYEERERTKVVTDKHATRAAIERRLDEAGAYFNSTADNWLTQRYEPSMQRIRADIRVARDGWEKRRHAVVKTQAMAKLRDDMRRLAKQIEAGLQSAAPAGNREKVRRDGNTESRNQRIEVSDRTAGILRLAREAVRRQHHATHKALHEALATDGMLPVIISWDKASLNDFLWQTGLDDAERIESPDGAVRLPESGRQARCVFVLVNTPQFGAARKQIESLRLGDSLRPDDYVVWVVQDLQELINTGRSVEGLEHMMALRETVPEGRSIVYLSHSNPAYNLGFLKYQLLESYRKAPERLMHEIQTTYRVYRTDAVEAELGNMFRRLGHHF